MKNSVLALLLLVMVAPVGFAQQNATDAPATKEDVERYLEVMHSREMMKNMMDAMTKQIHQMLHEQFQKTPNLPADFEAQEQNRIESFLRDYPVDELVQAIIPVFERHLTKGEVDDLVAFYSSPTGQKMLKEMPAMTAEAMQASQAIVQRTLAKQMQRVQDEIAAMQKQSGGATEKPQ